MKSFLFAFLLLFSINAFAQNARYTPQDQERFEQAMTLAVPINDLPMHQLVTEIAKSFIGTPYLSSSIESEEEELIINLCSTDCILFVEMCTALALTAKEKEHSFAIYCDNVRNLRYRNGIINGYDSRLHYTSDWILQNSARGIFTETTPIFGIPLSQSFSFMSSHPQYYKQLSGDNEMVRRIRITEERLNKANYSYIPCDNIPSVEKNIQDGDIICFVTPIEGLDVSHVALAYWQDGELHFIHASSKEKKVVIEKKTLSQYAKNGIRLLKFTTK